jgi:hypothetical protein
MTICLLGNSHLVSIKEAMDSRDLSHPGEVRWLYARGRALGTLKVVDDILLTDDATTKQLMEDKSEHSEVRVSEQSAFVIVGLGLSMQLAFEAMFDARLFSQPRSDQVLVSKALLHASFSRTLRQMTAFRIAVMLRQHSTAPIIIVPQPATLATIIDWVRPKRPRGRAPRQRIAERFDSFERIQAICTAALHDCLGADVVSLFEKTLLDITAQEGLSACLQPRDTLENGLTKAKFARVYVSRPMDVVHTNVDYGHRILTQLTQEYGLVW